jgi:hypothetical protein
MMIYTELVAANLAYNIFRPREKVTVKSSRGHIRALTLSAFIPLGLSVDKTPEIHSDNIVCGIPVEGKPFLLSMQDGQEFVVGHEWLEDKQHYVLESFRNSAGRDIQVDDVSQSNLPQTCAGYVVDKNTGQRINYVFNVVRLLPSETYDSYNPSFDKYVPWTLDDLTPAPGQ